VTPPLAEAQVPEVVYRLGRGPDPWEWPDWTRAGDDRTFGNRYDDPEGQYRVLYASSERQTTFRECLARFRPDLAVLAVEIAADDDEPGPPTRPPGHVKRSWIARPRIGTASLEGRFCDVGHSDSLAHLRAALASRVLHYGLDDLDAGDIRIRAPRG
jgi:hypothetical protein